MSAASKTRAEFVLAGNASGRLPSCFQGRWVGVWLLLAFMLPYVSGCGMTKAITAPKLDIGDDPLPVPGSTIASIDGNPWRSTLETRIGQSLVLGTPIVVTALADTSSIALFLPTYVLRVGRYDLTSDVGNSAYYFMPSGSGTQVWHTDGTHTGVCEIVSVDSVAHVATGRFAFSCVFGNASRTVSISRGRFSAQW